MTETNLEAKAKALLLTIDDEGSATVEFKNGYSASLYRGNDKLHIIIWWPSDAQHIRLGVVCNERVVEMLVKVLYETARMDERGPIQAQMDEMAEKAGTTPLYKFSKWYDSFDVIPTVKKLERFFDDVEDDEAAIALTKLTEWVLGHHPYGNELAEKIPGTVLNIHAMNAREATKANFN